MRELTDEESQTATIGAIITGVVIVICSIVSCERHRISTEAQRDEVAQKQMVESGYVKKMIPDHYSSEWVKEDGK